MQSSETVHSTSRYPLATGSGRPKTKQGNLGLLVLLSSIVALALAACTPSAGLGGTTSGWSPVAAVAIPLDTGSKINEGRNIDLLDNTFTVTNVAPFGLGQVIQIDDERVQITSIREQDLVVTRGADDTRPQTHADQSTIYRVDERFIVFVATKQGDIQALIDDGLEAPQVQWTCRQGGVKGDNKC